MPSHRFEISAEEADQRLDVVLARRLALSRGQTRKLLEGGSVTLDGVPVTRSVKGLALVAGSRIEVAGFVHPSERQAVPEPEAPLAILAEGPGWLAVDKPAGSPVHPLAPDERGTVLNALVARRPAVQGVGEGGLRSGVLHRLDVDTSGVLLFATEQDVWEKLRDAFASHAVAKTYRALVAGAPPDEGRLDLRLVVAQHRPALVRVAKGKGGRGTRMAFRVLERFASATGVASAALVEVRLETGFLHQIRVGFAHAGHPVLGDRLYAPPEVAAAAPRQMLHCARIEIGDVVAESPDPRDLEGAIRTLRGRP
jgi:23S rRNA pseudouridine1911/1915/1917 synthase